MKCHKDTTSPTGLLSMVKSWLGVDFMETAWDGHEMRECRLVPSVGSLSIHWSGEMATQAHSGLWSRRRLCLLILLIPPDPVELITSCTTKEEVDSK